MSDESTTADETDAATNGPDYRPIEVAIYRSTVKTFERAEDGEWDEVSAPLTITTWEPRPDEDRVIDYPPPARAFRVISVGGGSPVCRLRIPLGEFFEIRGVRFLRTPGERKLEPLSAYCRGLRRSGEIAIITGPIQEPAQVDRPAVVPLSSAPEKVAAKARPSALLDWAEPEPASQQRRKARKDPERLVEGDRKAWTMEGNSR